MFDHVGRSSDPGARARTAKSVALTSVLALVVAGAAVMATWIFVVEPRMADPEPQQWVEMIDPVQDLDPGAPPAPPIQRGSSESEPEDPPENRAYNVLPARSVSVGRAAGTGTSATGVVTGSLTGSAVSAGTATGGAGQRGPRIVHQRELEVRSRVQPAFPLVARRIGLTHGRCLATLKIDERGRVDEVLVDQCQAAFHGETIRALKQWRFAPYRVEGQASSAQTRIAITYTLR